MQGKKETNQYDSIYRNESLNDAKEKAMVFYNDLAYYSAKKDYKKALITFNALSDFLQTHVALRDIDVQDFIKNMTPLELINNPGVSRFLALLFETLNHHQEILFTSYNTNLEELDQKQINSVAIPFYYLKNLEMAFKLYSPLITDTTKWKITPEFKKDQNEITEFFNNLKKFGIKGKMQRAYTLEKPPGQIHGLYIESFEDLFTDITDQTYLKFVLDNINYHLNQCNQRFLPVFISYSDVKGDLIEKIRQFLPENSLLEQQIIKQKEENKTMGSFNKECEKKGVKNLLVGGTYAFGCVVAVSNEIGKNIYIKMDGRPSHMYEFEFNYRWIKKETPYLYENVIIEPSITQGFNPGDPKENVVDTPFVKLPSFAEVPHGYIDCFLHLEEQQSSKLIELPLEQQRQILSSFAPDITDTINPRMDYSAFAYSSSSALSRMRKRNLSTHLNENAPITSRLEQASRVRDDSLHKFFKPKDSKQEELQESHIKKTRITPGSDSNT